MRTALLFGVCGLLLVSRVALSQDVMTPEQVINRMISTGTLEGHDDKILGKMGDAAAVVVTKVLAGKEPSLSEMDMTLVVLTRAFADPTAVTTVADRQPKTALFVLAYFDSLTSDSGLKKRIADTKRYVQERYENSVTQIGEEKKKTAARS